MKSIKQQPETPPRATKSGKWIFAGVLALTIIPDFFLKKKGYFHAVETIPGFFALLGLVSVIVLFVLAKILEPVLKRREDYYE